MTYYTTGLPQDKLTSDIEDTIQKYNPNIDSNNANDLAKVMYQTLLFNRALSWRENAYVFLPKSPQELIEIYKLRKIVYEQMGYGKELPSNIDGLDFDSFDIHSAILYTKNNDIITSTCRVIFDSELRLPIDKMHSFDNRRKQGKQIAELSRLAKINSDGGLSREFKYLVVGAYHTMIDNDMDILVSAMIPKHYKLYKNFGGFDIEKELDGYGSLDVPFVVTSWEVSMASDSFKRIFLGIRKSNSTSKSGNRLYQLAG